MTDGRRAARLAALVVKLPSQPLIFVELHNAAHAPIFGTMAIVWFHILRRYSTLGHWQRYLAAFALTAAIGGVIKLIQPAFDRGSEKLNLMTDALRAFAGLAARAACELRRPWLLLTSVVAGVPVLWPVGEAAMAYRLRAQGFPALLGYDAQRAPGASEKVTPRAQALKLSIEGFRKAPPLHGATTCSPGPPLSNAAGPA
jgi:hypothetical protein